MQPLVDLPGLLRGLHEYEVDLKRRRGWHLDLADIEAIQTLDEL